MLGVQVNPVTLVTQDLRVLLDSLAQLVEREIQDLLVNLVCKNFVTQRTWQRFLFLKSLLIFFQVSAVSKVLLVLMVRRVFLVSQELLQQPMDSSSPDTARPLKFPIVLKEQASSMTDTPCCTCRATREHTDKTWVRRLPQTSKC